MEYLEEEYFKDISQITKYGDAEFSECTFEGLDLSNVTFRNCLFNECLFISCALNQTRVQGCSFRDVSFINSKLVGVNWTEANSLSSLRFDKSKIDYSIFLGLKLNSFICTSSEAKSCDFSECNLKSADFCESNLLESSFNHSNLEKAIFSDSKNYRIDPSVTKLKGATFSHPEVLSLLMFHEIKIDNIN